MSKGYFRLYTFYIFIPNCTPFHYQHIFRIDFHSINSVTKKLVILAVQELSDNTWMDTALETEINQLQGFE